MAAHPADSQPGMHSGGGGAPSFPSGLRLLVVDDDPTCLMIVAGMLRKCNYEVTTSVNGLNALALLRSQPNHFDLVLSDVVMPDMDGFKLLEHIGLELDLPVIMMSANGETSTVLRGVTHGAVDFLIKPVRIEELRNVWQHVVRRRRTGSAAGATDAEEEDEEGSAQRRAEKKRKDTSAEKRPRSGDSDGEGGNAKKARVVWSVEMHQQFVNAVNTLGVDKAVPKRILDLMNVEGLTRENVASHLQKYRLYLKRVQGVQPGSRGSGGATPSMHHGHDSSLFSHALGSSDQDPGAAGAERRQVQHLQSLQMSAIGMPSASGQGGLPGGLLSSGLGAGSLSGLGSPGDLAGGLTYGPPPSHAASDLGLGLTYGPPPVGGMGIAPLSTGSGSGLGGGLSGGGLDYGPRPPMQTGGFGPGSGLDHSSIYATAGGPAGGLSLGGFGAAANDFGDLQDPFVGGAASAHSSMHDGTLMGGPSVSSGGGGANPYMHPQQQPAQHMLYGGGGHQQHRPGHHLGGQLSDVGGGGGNQVKQEAQGNSNMDDILNMFLKDD